MTFSDFINKYINTKVDFDGAFGAQCVDLFRQYCKDVLNIPHTGSVEGAKDLYLRWEFLPLEKKYFRKIPITNIKSIKDIKYGDVLVFDKTPKNQYGHVVLFVTFTKNDEMLVFEQNGLKQDGAKLSTRTIENVLGILRFDWSK